VYKFLGLYLLIIVGIFIEFSFIGNVGNTIVKILILAVISYFLYEFWKEFAPVEEETETELETEVEPKETQEPAEQKRALFFDIKSTPITDLFENNSDFRDFIVNQFMIIWGFVYPKNGYVIYKNKEEDIRLVHKNLQPEVLIEPKQNPTSLFTLIENKNGILVENNIEQTLHLIPYYQEESYSPKSLLGFVISFESGEKLYWIFDSDLPDNFNLDDMGIMERINKNTESMTKEALLTSGLNMTCFEVDHKFQIADRLNKANGQEECLDIFCDFVTENFEASKLTIGIRKDNDIMAEIAVIAKAIGIDDPYKVGYEFPIDEGVNGMVILKNKPLLFEDIEQGEYFVARFSKEEKSNYSLRSYLSVPIEIDTSALGMVTLEDKNEKKYNNSDKKKLIEYTSILSNALLRFQEIN